jgi:death-on-curing protein
MTGWRWIGEAVVLAIDDEQLAEHGGRSGLRDPGLLQSALARPINRAAYAGGDAFDFAAAYAFGIVRNHPFIDANKRTAFVLALLCLLDHGHELEAAEADKTLTMLRLAEGAMTEEAFAAWLRENCVAAEE